MFIVQNDTKLFNSKSLRVAVDLDCVLRKFYSTVSPFMLACEKLMPFLSVLFYLGVQGRIV